MPKGEGKLVAQNKKATMIILLKKRMKQELFFKVQRLNPFGAGKVNLKDSYARIQNGEAILYTACTSAHMNKGIVTIMIH